MQISAKATLGLAKETANSWSADYAPSMGAALSYYTLFSIAPLLLIAIAIAGAVFGEQAARHELVDEIRDTVGKDAALAIQNMITQARDDHGGWLATLLGIVILLFGASGVFGQL